MKRNAIIVDVDGTIADTSMRSALALYRQIIKGEHFWDALFDPEKISMDTPIPGSKECLKELAKRGRLIYLTGRRSTTRKETEAWLKEHEYPEGLLIMREKGMKTEEFKPIEIEKLKEHYNIVCGVGDSQSDIEAYEETGIPEKVLVGTNKEWDNCPCLEAVMKAIFE